MKLWLIIGLVFLGCQAANCQVEMNYELLHYMAAKEPDPDPNDREQIKKQFQTYFIKQVFLNSVFKSNHLYYGEDNPSDYGLVNQLMINQFAEQLVETDVIDLSHISLDE
ncbi:hypothetical protein DID73_02250 [Candidatus Marinamargulisbacteria bacterium SCGC AG-343-K17]|nr:hypothetical protein DID73_02250 [Candidatus Marinamargulisbacteria bacterium SCGC AG-343-K17]